MTLVPFVHASEPVYATVFRTGTVPAVTAFDFVSILDGFRGGLTTSADSRAGTLPAGPGNSARSSTAPGSSRPIDYTWRASLAPFAGLPAKRASAQEFASGFKTALARQREDFQGRPVRYALVALWRSVSKRHPHNGSLASQPAASVQVRELQTGRYAQR